MFGLGPIGDMSTRIAKHRGAGQVIAVDLVPERLARAKSRGITTLDASKLNDDEVDEAIRELTKGRGADAVIDAVGTEAHGSPLAKFVQDSAGLLPDAAAQKLFMSAGVDRMNVLHHAINSVRRGGTLSIVGVYSGQADPMPIDTLFDRQIQLRMGQANVRRWTDDILPLLTDKDVLGVDDFATHHLSLDDAPHAYEMFQKKEDGAIKILFHP